MCCQVKRPFQVLLFSTPSSLFIAGCLSSFATCTWQYIAPFTWLEPVSKIRTVCYHQHYLFCNQLFLALTDVTDVALNDASVKVPVVLYKRCTFCPVFFALSTIKKASHSWGETFGDQKRHRLVCGKLLENHDPARITQKLFHMFVESCPTLHFGWIYKEKGWSI